MITQIFNIKSYSIRSLMFWNKFKKTKGYTKTTYLYSDEDRDVVVSIELFNSYNNRFGVVIRVMKDGERANTVVSTNNMSHEVVYTTILSWLITNDSLFSESVVIPYFDKEYRKLHSEKYLIEYFKPKKAERILRNTLHCVQDDLAGFASNPFMLLFAQSSPSFSAYAVVKAFIVTFPGVPETIFKKGIYFYLPEEAIKQHPECIRKIDMNRLREKMNGCIDEIVNEL